MADIRFVPSLPDLIEPDEYPAHADGDLVRIRIRVTDHGVEILGDAMRPEAIEAVLSSAEPAVIDQMLCG
jgi:hypothetical protein